MALSNLNPFSKKPEEAKPAAIKKKEAKVKNPEAASRVMKKYWRP